MTTLHVEFPLAPGAEAMVGARLTVDLKGALNVLGVYPYLVYPDWRNQCVHAFAWTHKLATGITREVLEPLLASVERGCFDMGLGISPVLYTHRWYMMDTDTMHCVLALHPISSHRAHLKGERDAQKGDRPTAG